MKERPKKESDRFMRIAIAQARKSARAGRIPIGNVLVRNGRIIGCSHNQRVQKQNPILHAEIDCLQNAGRQRTYRGTTRYSTLMPCHLCAGAVVQSGIKKVVVGESMTCQGAKRFLRAHKVKIVDLLSDECKRLMADLPSKTRSFAQRHRKITFIGQKEHVRRIFIRLAP